MKTSETTSKIIPALLKISEVLINIEKNKENPFFKSKYADLPSLLEIIKPDLSENKLFIIQEAPMNESGRTSIISRIIHESGEWIETNIDLTPNKNDSQGAGGAITYGRRYALLALLNMGQSDDDGNGTRSAKKEQANKKLETIKQKTEIMTLISGKCSKEIKDIQKYIKDETSLDLEEKNYELIIKKLKNGTKDL